VLWQGPSGLNFLCRVINFGRSTDELKIIITEPDSPTGAMYTEGRGHFTGTEIVRMQGEVSYHGDGKLHIKMPSYGPRTSDEYRNPSGTGVRRLPLRDIRDWEPFVRYTVVHAVVYKRPAGSGSGAIVARCDAVLDGGPFECTFALGPATLEDPIQPSEHAHLRIRGVTQSLDLLLSFEKSSYRGEVMRLPNSGQPIVMANNVLEVVERRLVFRPIITTTWK
jgi:hypothetical protein